MIVIVNYKCSTRLWDRPNVIVAWNWISLVSFSDHQLYTDLVSFSRLATPKILTTSSHLLHGRMKDHSAKNNLEINKVSPTHTTLHTHTSTSHQHPPLSHTLTSNTYANTKAHTHTHTNEFLRPRRQRRCHLNEYCRDKKRRKKNAIFGWWWRHLIFKKLIFHKKKQYEEVALLISSPPQANYLFCQFFLYFSEKITQ